MSLIALYLTFFQIGLFAFGGGLATLPFLFRLADKYEWLSHENIGNMLAIVQSSPGPIGVNMSTQTGFYAAGVPGAVVAPLGLVSPAIIVIIVVAKMLETYKENKTVMAVFSGLRPAATGLLTVAILGTWKLSLYNAEFSVWYEIIVWKALVFLIIIYLGVVKFKLHPIVYVIVAGAVGIILKL